MDGWPFDSYTSNAVLAAPSRLIRAHFSQEHLSVQQLKAGAGGSLQAVTGGRQAANSPVRWSCSCVTGRWCPVPGEDRAELPLIKPP